MSVGIAEVKERGSIAFVYFVSFVAALGGLMFGFYTGVISGAIPFITEKFNLNPVESGFAVGNVSLACVIGASIAGILCDRFGRKKIFYFSALVFIVSAFTSALSNTFMQFLIWRFTGGIFVGVVSVLSPMYISEIAPANIRGRLVSFNQFAIVFGMLIAYVINWLVVDIGPDNWRWMFAYGAPPAIIFLLMIFFIPESPRWLTIKGKSEKAFEILARSGGRKNAESEMAEIKESLKMEEGSFRELLKPGLRKVFAVGLILSFFSTATGIGPATYYAPTIFLEAGYESASAAFFASILVVVTILAFTLVVTGLVDRLGRKPLLIIGLAGMAISMCLIGVAFSHFTGHGSWIIVPMLGFVAFYAMSLGAIIWIVISEIFPNKIRGVAMSASTMVLWTSDFAFAQTFPWLIEKLGGATFFIYGAVSVIALIFVITMLTETKGKSLEEIEKMWQS
jgi:MFS transporter, SP family, arabinose:H+ symporter